MILLILWVVGVVGWGWVLVRYDLWRVGFALFACASYIVWVVGGALACKLALSGKLPRNPKRPEWPGVAREAAERDDRERETREARK